MSGFLFSINSHISGFTVKPHIDRDALKNLTSKAGQSISFDVPVSGEPAPTVTWHWPDNREIRNGGRVKLDNPEYQSKLVVRQMERGDSGTFTIKAVNVNGEDEATVKINVIGMIRLSSYL